MTDETIMQMVSAGDLNKTSILFERYQVSLYNFFYRLTYDQALSEDLTQNVFERVIRYKHSFNNQHSFKSWIYQIARNVKIDYHKKNKIKTAEINLQKLSLFDCCATDVIEQNEIKSNIEKALTLLNEEQREVLILTRFQKMKYQEVAILLGCSEGAVKVKVHRAIKQLRKIYLKIDAL